MVTVSATFDAGALTQPGIIAAVSPVPLQNNAAVPSVPITNAVEAAMLMIASPSSTDVLTASVAALVKGAAKTMFLSKMKTATALLLILATGTAVGTFGQRALAQRQRAAETPAKLTETKPANAESPKSKQPRLDLHGNPLPEGALARLGTVRMHHGGPVRSLLYSPDGKTVISGSDMYDSSGSTQTIRCWDVNSGKEVRQFVIPPRKTPGGNQNAVTSLALSSDGKTLAAGTTDGSIYLWDFATGKQLHECQGVQGTSVVFSHNGKVLASCGAFEGVPSQVRLWEVSTGKELRRLAVELPSIGAVAFSPISDTLAVNGDGKIVIILDAATGEVLHKLEGHVNTIMWRGVAFSRDGKTLASGDIAGDVRVWSVESGKQLQQLGHQSVLWAVGFGADGMLATSGFGDGIRFWDAQTGKQLRHLRGLPGDVDSLAFSPDGKTLACGNSNGVISFWDVATTKQVRRTPGHLDRLNAVAISPDGRTLATASSDTTVGLWDAASAKELGNLKGHKDGVHFVAFSPNGKLLASADHSTISHGVVILWDRATGEELRRFKGCCMAFSPDGKQIACGGLDDESRRPGIIRLHDVETGELIRRFNGHKAGVQNIAFSPDGKTLASASYCTMLLSLAAGEQHEDYTVRLWDVASGRERCKFDGSDTLLPSILTFSPDGRLLVSAHRFSSQINVWEVSTGKIRRVLTVKDVELGGAVHFMPDGRTLAVGSSRAVAEFLDLATGHELGRIRSHSDAVTGFALSPDAKTLFSGSADTTALVWDLPSVFTPPRPGLAPLPGGRVESLWADLANTDAAKADRAIWTLIASPQASISFLEDHLRPAVAPEAKRIDKLIADLDSNRFAVREKASQELEKLGELAGQAISQALANKPTLEVRRRLESLLAKIERQELSSTTLRQVRAMEVLEHTATPEARDLLKNLAAGATEARLTQEAKASLERLESRARHESLKINGGKSTGQRGSKTGTS